MPDGSNVMNTEDHSLFICSLLIAIFGTIANTVSLSYFIQVSGRASESPTTKLFAALNIFDLLLGVSSAVECLFFQFYYVPNGYEVAEALLKTSLHMTALFTCLLALVRGIHLILPHHIINWKAVNVSIAVYSFIVVVLRALFLNYAHSDDSEENLMIKFVERFDFVIMTGVFLIVVLTNVISLTKLYLSQSHSSKKETWKRQATITVAIISIIYCLCNVGFIVMFGAQIGMYPHFSIPLSSRVKLADICYYILLPLNSACHPVIYLFRKKQMRSYVASLRGRSIEISFFSKQERKDNSTVSFAGKTFVTRADRTSVMK